MLELLLRRLFVRDRSQFGLLYFHGEEAQCFTLEDVPRDVKVAGETCIPSGRYELKLRDFGGLYGRYKERFAWNEPGMLWLQAVPQFSDVLIHCGATDKDTAGCLLLGDRADCHRPSLAGSVDAYQRAYTRITPHLQRGERVHIEVKDIELVRTITA